MSDAKWFFIAVIVIAVAGGAGGALTEILNSRYQATCKIAYATSNKSVEEIKKLCE